MSPNAVAPIDTRAFVLSPAFLCRHWRSIPTSVPNRADSRSRKAGSKSLMACHPIKSSGLFVQLSARWIQGSPIVDLGLLVFQVQFAGVIVISEEFSMPTPTNSGVELLLGQIAKLALQLIEEVRSEE